MNSTPTPPPPPPPWMAPSTLNNPNQFCLFHGGSVIHTCNSKLLNVVLRLEITVYALDFCTFQYKLPSHDCCLTSGFLYWCFNHSAKPSPAHVRFLSCVISLVYLPTLPSPCSSVLLYVPNKLVTYLFSDRQNETRSSVK